MEPFDPKPETNLPAAAQTLADHIDNGGKVFFFSDISNWANDSAAWEILTRATGWSGTGNHDAPGDDVSTPSGDSRVFKGEAETIPSGKISLPDLRTPENGVVLIRQTAKTHGVLTNCDSAFVAPFGGVLLEPWIFETDPLKSSRGRVDFFAFVDRRLGEPPPALDTTTLAGCRLYFAHVDGDALHAQSTVTPGKKSGEVMRDRIFKKIRPPLSPPP